jgi:NlpC/P60 family
MILKTCLPLAVICLLLTSCSSFNDLYESHSSSYNNVGTTMQRTTYLTNVEVNTQENRLAKSTSSIVNVPKEVAAESSSLPAKLSNFSSIALESLLPMQFKYAIMMNATVEKITNVSLYKVIDDWFGTRYRFGGTTRKGIDCSALMQVIGQYVFGWALPRTAHAQYAIMEKVAREDIKEGDFVYFHTTRRGVSHVGMCLQNNKFVHASTSKGVIISDLDEAYWDNRIIGFKRMKDEALSLTN